MDCDTSLLRVHTHIHTSPCMCTFVRVCVCVCVCVRACVRACMCVTCKIISSAPHTYILLQELPSLLLRYPLQSRFSTYTVSTHPLKSKSIPHYPALTGHTTRCYQYSQVMIVRAPEALIHNTRAQNVREMHGRSTHH